MRWEYLVIKKSLDAEQLDELGAEGWELVAVASPGHFVLHHFFKREVGK
ncbi:hypothetical protein [Sphingosinicella rhizophila]|uniref:DUF4177 domain-containing protein n=1 Tax=Sphingosinicella rhizophila TaxID=3050082 RepID=A0ABU3QCR3_9SPHN|nr:hypothetical protein [Sphingosinicella sp. GR2756]MDT9600778.1 hypothetical protein [Sphingosinicella sp. GR2756]